MSKDKEKSKIKKYLIPTVLLFMFWMILSPGFGAQTIFMGILLSILVVVYSKDILFSAKEMPLYQGKHFVNMLRFIGVLIIEIFKANIEVAKIVLDPKLPIEPHFIKVPMMLENDMNKVIYGNSVTLTPGTLTVDIVEDGFIIHALTKEAAEAMEGSFIETWMAKQEDKKC
ncbi:Na+/H+ antiporter subunit E [Tindallia californiensis]|uniref:Multicomponent Na+:H+ antiporter subunit E n=1 Tax=Tindallia californiensis TaxID=159292 RepID=A0A1H3K5K9_9FIRM|nr:Na+/H+ antiporter subunit E [Tindallia californiensis]SDY47456.1 multicomponent Na+:H+ antiporter subunit E [Tindallia californiensis]